jgi:hypothetical protein
MKVGALHSEVELGGVDDFYKTSCMRKIRHMTREMSMIDYRQSSE